ncbi:hypothetical protein Ais01nite_75070 [Asanoa ishikariensis]|uniref:Uncharacterized protein n=1 Tax=Asanoa ishikariensis TaxID=137265 RepID=A0A1H3L7I0_9ACTN|nr:hypothetical protein [Asanoa ishikariensis]GIF69472.1 hypothetical protein Ais01nite_75070 [Asanoa ishikariensis]SDY59884.1 hypothetical protein SAMN05421684_0562 [Asanoa ishikariensis]
MSPAAFSIDEVGALADTISKATLAAAAVVAVVVILVGLSRAIRERLRQQLVINDTAPLPAAIAGSEGEALTLSPWLRQRVQAALADEAAAARGIVDDVFQRDVALHRLPAEIAITNDTEPITSAAKDTMATVANGLRAVAPGQADGILGALSSALPNPRGCLVQTAPLLRGDAGNQRLGLAIELHELDGSPIAATTLWEPPGTNPSGQSWQERLVALIEPAAHWVALRLVARRLRAMPAGGLRVPWLSRRRSLTTRLELQRMLAAALTLDAMKEFTGHTLAFGAEALDDLDQVGFALRAYHRPAAIRGAVQERLGFAYRTENVEAKARRAFLDASESYAEAEQRLVTNPGDNASSTTATALADERERHRVRRLKCALLSGDLAATTIAGEELRDQPPKAAGDARTLYAIACLYSCAAERVEKVAYLPLAWSYLGRALLAATEELMWDQARADPELAFLVDRQRFVDDLNHTWAVRRRRKAPALLVTEAEALVLAAVGRLAR